MPSYNHRRLRAMHTAMSVVSDTCADLRRVIDGNVPTGPVDSTDIEKRILLLRGAADFVNRTLPQLAEICQGVIEIGRLTPLYKEPADEA